MIKYKSLVCVKTYCDINITYRRYVMLMEIHNYCVFRNLTNNSFLSV